MSSWRDMTFSDLMKAKIAILDEAYCELTGQDPVNGACVPRPKAALKGEIVNLLRAEEARTRMRHKDRRQSRQEKADAQMRRAWREENDRIRDVINSVFDGMAPPPLWGEEGESDG